MKRDIVHINTMYEVILCLFHTLKIVLILSSKDYLLLETKTDILKAYLILQWLPLNLYNCLWQIINITTEFMDFSIPCLVNTAVSLIT